MTEARFPTSYRTASGTAYDLGGGHGLLLNPVGGPSWEFEASGAGFIRKARDISAELTAIGTDAMAECDRMLEGCAADLEAGTPGTLTVGEWSLACYLRRGKSKGLTSGWQGWDVDLYAPDPVWTREHTTSFLPQSGAASSTGGHDLPLDYPYDYGNSARASRLAVDALTPCDVRISFYGRALSPSVYIGGNRYGVDGVTVPDGGMLVIDPTRRDLMDGTAVCLYDRYGTATDVFAKRVRGTKGSGSYIFERVEPGEHVVTWPQTYGVDVTTIERRGHLPWT